MAISFSEFVERVNGLTNIKIIELLEIAVDNNKETAIQLNKEVLIQGKTSAGRDVSPLYKEPEYASFKQTFINSLPSSGVPDLYLSGNFYRSFFTEVNKNLYGVTLSFGATDEKAPALLSKYKNVLGLGGEELAELVELIKQDFIKLLENYIKR